MKKVYTIATFETITWWFTAQDALEAACNIEHYSTKIELLAMYAALLKHLRPRGKFAKDPVVIWIPDGNHLATTLLAKTVENGTTYWMVPQGLRECALSLGYDETLDGRQITLDL
jgi:hypothetical protein